MFVDLFLDDLSCRFFVTSIICPLDVLSVDVLSVSLRFEWFYGLWFSIIRDQLMSVSLYDTLTDH